MLHHLRSRALLSSLLSLTCAGAVLAACGGGTKQVSGTTTGATTGTGGAGGTGGSAGGGGDDGGILDIGDAGTTQTLTVTPGTATIAITNKMVPATKTFTALLDGVPATNVSWTLDSYAEGSISGAGTFTTTGLVGGQAHVTATLGQLTATAVLTVDIQLSETVLQSPTDPGPSAGNTTALMGTPMPDPGATASPPNVTADPLPVRQDGDAARPHRAAAPVQPGQPPAGGRAGDALVHVLLVEGASSTCPTPAMPQFSIPQDIWDGALLSTGGQTLTIDVTKAAASMAYGPAHHVDHRRRRGRSRARSTT